MNLVVRVALPALLFSVSAFSSQSDDTDNSNEVKYIEKITVEGSATANKIPVGTFGSPISNLEYDPRVDLQSRNMAEAQADVTIRGGIFENTGFRVGSATLFDDSRWLSRGADFKNRTVENEIGINARVVSQRSTVGLY